MLATKEKWVACSVAEKQEIVNQWSDEYVDKPLRGLITLLDSLNKEEKKEVLVMAYNSFLPKMDQLAIDFGDAIGELGDIMDEIREEMGI